MMATFSLARLVSPAAPSAADQQRYLRLHDAPITLYPTDSVAGSGVAGFFNDQARPQDAIVVSHLDALKESARLSALGLGRGEIWVHVPREPDLTQAGRRQLEGAKGIVYVPAARRADRLSAAGARRIAESAATLGCRMIAGFEPEQARDLNHIADLARHASILTIYDSLRLQRGGAEYRAYVERLVREARAANPSIQIEVCIATGRDAAATQALAGVLWTCADLADRIGIYCNDTAESRASLALLLQVLRGAPPA
jgi:hypothetical protein